jgi:hypothetical protein
MKYSYSVTDNLSLRQLIPCWYLGVIP